MHVLLAMNNLGGGAGETGGPLWYASGWSWFWIFWAALLFILFLSWAGRAYRQPNSFTGTLPSDNDLSMELNSLRQQIRRLEDRLDAIEKGGGHSML